MGIPLPGEDGERCGERPSPPLVRLVPVGRGAGVHHQRDRERHRRQGDDTVSDGRELRRDFSRISLPANAADAVKVTLIITEQVSTVEHQDPRCLRVPLEGRGRPVG